MELIPKIYDVIRGFPKEEEFALSGQMRRAAISVAANIAEGQARQHRKEFLQHLSIAKGSLAELHTLVLVAQKLGYVETLHLTALETEFEELARPLHGLIKAIGASS